MKIRITKWQLLILREYRTLPLVMHSNAGFPLGEFVRAFSFVGSLFLTCKEVATNSPSGKHSSLTNHRPTPCSHHGL
jgi:hypothetical protein